MNHFLLIMRTVIILLFTCVFISVAETGLSQNAKVSLNKNNVNLKEVLNEIENQTDYLFIYNNQVNTDNTVSVNTDNNTVKEVLTHVLQDSNIGFLMEGNHIILSYIEKTINDKDKDLTEEIKQQGRTITGVVTDSYGDLLPGVTIVIKGKARGTTTDIDGRYTLTDVLNNDILQFSFVGMLSEEVTVRNQTKIDVVLEEETIGIEEIVVTGYSVQRKVDITGSVEVVNVDKMTSTPAGSPEQMLQGQASGVNIVTSGEPGIGSSIRIRGISSTGDNDPLIIIDGVQGDLRDINSNDIESVQILKDAGAAAIYGVRGSNGVVIVTTKRGRSEKPRISYEGYVGIQTPPTGNVFNLLNTQEMADATWIALRNANQVDANGNPNHGQYGNGEKPVIPDFLIIGNQYGVNRQPTQEELDSYNVDFSKGPIYQIVEANKKGTDWFGEIFSPAFVQSHNLSVGAKKDRSTYFLSLGYFDQKGTLMNTFLKRYSLRVNTNFNINDNITIGENLYFNIRSTHLYRADGIQHISDTGNPIALTFLAQPIIPTHDYFGNYAGTRPKDTGQSPSPFAVVDRRKNDENKQNSVQGNIFGQIKFLNHFLVRSTFGGWMNNRFYNNYVARTYEEAENNVINSYNEAARNNWNWTFTNTLNYDQKFDKHSVQALLGIEAVSSYSRGVGGASLGYFSENPDYVTLSTGSSGFTNFSNVYKNNLYSQFTKLDYIFDNRYIVSSTVRRDGSSRFGKDKRWGVFPSVSAGWRMANESFFEDITWVSNLTLKGSWGKLGNQLNVNPSNAFDLYGSHPRESYYDIDGTDNNPKQGFRATRIGNEQTGWEEDILTNIGIDAALFNHKLTFSIEYYQKKVKGLLFEDQSPATVGGATLPTINIGNIENKGIDFTSNYRSVTSSGFKFDIGVNLTHYKSNISDIPGDYFEDGYTRTGYFVRNRVGHPVGAFFGYKIERLFRDEQDVTNSPKQTAAAPGRFKYKDVDGDGVITDKDRTTIGDPNPDFVYGLNLGGEYKNIDFSLFFYGSQGNDAVNYQRWWTDFYPSFAGVKSKNLLYNSWTPDNLDAKTPINENNSNFSNNGVPNSYYVEDASFLKLKNATLGFTMPQEVLDAIKVEKLRIYLQVANLFTLTKYSGLDPELAGSSTAFGIDHGNYPNNQRSFNLGLNLSF